MPGPSDPPEAPRKRSKEGHFLSQQDKAVLDAGPDPYASLDEQRRSEMKEERRAHQKRYYQVLAQAKERARAALTDLWWLTSTLEDDFAREVFMHEVRPGVGSLEFVVFEAVGHLGWERVPEDIGGKGEFFAERLTKAVASALSTRERRVRVEIVLPGVEGPLASATPVPARSGARHGRRGRGQTSEKKA